MGLGAAFQSKYRREVLGDDKVRGLVWWGRLKHSTAWFRIWHGLELWVAAPRICSKPPSPQTVVQADSVTCSFFGDGTCNVGQFYEVWPRAQIKSGGACCSHCQRLPVLAVRIMVFGLRLLILLFLVPCCPLSP